MDPFNSTQEHKDEIDNINSAIIQKISTDIIELAPSYSLLFKASYENVGLYSICPSSVLPCKISRKLYNDTITASTIFAELYHKLSIDKEYLLSILSSMKDEYTMKLVDIAHESMKNGYDQIIDFSICRSDYMIERRDGHSRMLQVEYNTISAGLPFVSEKMCKMMEQLLDKYSYCISEYYNASDFESNRSIKIISESIYDAYKMYNISNPCMIYVVQNQERNIADQRLLETYLFRKYKIKIFRLTLLDIYNDTTIDSEGNLCYKDFIICFAYFRAGYTPKDYPTNKEWEGRLRLELSRSIKCPNIFTNLTTLKKIQQVLADRDVMVKYISPEKCDFLSKFNCRLYAMYDVGILNKLLCNPEDYVIKPQREGGGNNIFGPNIIDFVKTIDDDKKSSYIAMDRIKPSTRHGYYIDRNKLIYLDDIVSEYGFFTIVKGDVKDGDIIYNKPAGYLLRSKSNKVDEGGVASGYSFVDTLIFDRSFE